jgi:hypothetical protein
MHPGIFAGNGSSVRPRSSTVHTHTGTYAFELPRLEIDERNVWRVWAVRTVRVVGVTN